MGFIKFFCRTSCGNPHLQSGSSSQADSRRKPERMDSKPGPTLAGSNSSHAVRLLSDPIVHPALQAGAFEVWRLERTAVANSITRAVPLTGAERAVAGIPDCGFRRPVFRMVGREIVVDAAVFSDLRTVRVRGAATFGPAGEIIGRVVAEGNAPRNLVKLLVHAGVIDANVHLVAAVAITAEGRDDAGHWFRLLSDDRFWTDRDGRDLYAFGVRVSPAGLIRVVNPNSLHDG